MDYFEESDFFVVVAEQNHNKTTVLINSAGIQSRQRKISLL